MALFVAAAEVVHPRQPHGGVVGLASAAGEEHVVEAVGKPALDQQVRQRDPIGRRPQGDHVVDVARSAVGDCVGHLVAAVADVVDHRPGGAVEDAAAAVGDQLTALGLDDGARPRRLRGEREAQRLGGRVGHRAILFSSAVL